MKKIIKWIPNNILLIISIAFLLFIPLYPKIPLFDIKHTWVNIRIEDFLIAASFLVFGIMLLAKRATLRTPLTIPIVLFWLIGLVSTIYAVLFIFPNLTNVFPQLAALHYLRRIEYLGVFFLGYSAIRGQKGVHIVTAALVIVTLVAVFYGIGQKFWGFPAYLTGNEEFSKGTPLRLAENARITSTFAGHYDLSAYLVLVVPIFLSMIFAIKKWWARIVLFMTGTLGYILLLMTASRVSFGAFLVSIALLLTLLKKKKLIIPALIAALLISTLFEGMTERFGKTISQVDLVVDARTGQAIGVAGSEGNDVVVEDKTPEGDELKTGTGFINIRGEGKGTAKEIVYKRSRIGGTGDEEEVTTIEGDFVIQRGFAYDVSFTTRFQGTWPRAIKAFDRNQLTGSGYSTINLASDNNYLRILGETGVLGLASFALIFIVYAIYLRRVLPKVKSPAIKTFALGLSAGIVGLALNATLIDVFEASKVAFSLWFLMGLSLGMLHLYEKNKIPYLDDLKILLTSTPAIVIYIFLIIFGVFRVGFGNFFVADDFTWLRWADECQMFIPNVVNGCESALQEVVKYFTAADGFFYRPGTKIFFSFFYSFFSLDANKYHYASAFLHALTALGFFLIARKLLKNQIFAAVSAVIWAILAIHYESLFWISALGHLICFASIVYSMVFYIYAENRKKYVFIPISFLFALISPLFHEVGIVTPLILTSYHFIFSEKKFSKRSLLLILYFLIIPAYLYLRYVSGSHWSGGDYSYNISKLPLNVVGNAIGYILVTLGGPDMLAHYDSTRAYLRDNTNIALLLTAVFALVSFATAFVTVKKVTKRTGKIILFMSFFFVFTLLPFLALGNITPRYVYLASFAPIFLLVYFVMYLHSRTKSLTRKIFIAFTIVLLSIYLYYNIAQLRERGEEWQTASTITENFLIGFYDHYPDETFFEKHRTFYFVNVPIKYNSAWVFPTGVEDPLYFALNTDNFTVIQVDEVTDELRQKIENQEIQLFIFNENGFVEELTRQKVPVANE